MGFQVLDPIGAHHSVPRPALRRLELAEDAAGERPLVIVAPAYLSLLRSLLVDVECDVEFGLDGPHVLDLVRQRHPRLLLVGADTPGIDGFSVCKLVNSAPVTRLPVLIVTSRASSDDQFARQVAPLQSELRAANRGALEI
jgi:CheY-like chemotaxis protein